MEDERYPPYGKLAPSSKAGFAFVQHMIHHVDEGDSNYINDEYIDKIVSAYTKREDIDKYCHKAYMDEIEKNDYNLNIPRYVDTFEEEESVDIAANKRKLAELETKEKAALDKVNAFLAELGL